MNDGFRVNPHQKLRATGGRRTYLTHSARGHVLLDTDRVDCDLWRMQHHLRSAAATTDPDIRIRTVRDAVAEYRGPLAADQNYFWIPPIREATRRAAIDAHTTLADLLTDRDPAAAAAILAHAIDHDLHNETLYQHAMRLHARVGNRDAISRLYARLIRELADIGTTPTSDTTQCVRALLGPDSTGEA